MHLNAMQKQRDKKKITDHQNSYFNMRQNIHVFRERINQDHTQLIKIGEWFYLKIKKKTIFLFVLALNVAIVTIDCNLESILKRRDLWPLLIKNFENIFTIKSQYRSFDFHFTHKTKLNLNQTSMQNILFFWNWSRTPCKVSILE